MQGRMSTLKKTKLIFFFVASVMGLSFFTFIYRTNIVEKISFEPFRDSKSRIANIHLRDMTVEFELVDKKQMIDSDDQLTHKPDETLNNALHADSFELDRDDLKKQSTFSITKTLHSENTATHEERVSSSFANLDLTNDSISRAKPSVTRAYIKPNVSNTRTTELHSSTYSVSKYNLATHTVQNTNRTASDTHAKANDVTEKETNAKILTAYNSNSDLFVKPTHSNVIGFNKHRNGRRKKYKINHQNSFTRIKDDLLQNGIPEQVAEAIMKKHGIESDWDFKIIHEDTRRDSCENCFKLNFTHMLVPYDMCAGNADVLLLITSTASNLEARSVIRETWGAACNTPTTNIRCVFVFGNTGDLKVNGQLKGEAKKYNDILQIDFHDTYANLTYKTITALQWAAQNCGNTKYVMKTDDDMFVNTELLPIFIRGAPDRNFLGGHCWGPGSPHRDINSKWFVSFRQYRHPYFPAMCSGTGYIMSTDLVRNIINVSNNIPFFHLEDVYIAICAKKIGVQPVLLSGFKNEIVGFTPCVYRNLVITSHGFSPESLRQVWGDSRTCTLSDLSPSQVFRYMPV